METYNLNNILYLASFIQDKIKFFITNNENAEYEDVVNYTLKETMKFGRGKYNPSFIKELIYLEKSIFNNSNINIPL